MTEREKMAAGMLYDLFTEGMPIGEGSVIGAGSIVTRDIPANSLAAGNPCRVIRPITEKDRLHL